MKKIKLLFVSLIVLFVFIGTMQVNASCAIGAQVGEEKVCLVSGATQGNANGTAYPENGVLVLKNYNGGKITYTSGLGDPPTPVTIKLEGDNYITSNDSYGIGTFTTGVNFVGNGTLTITSKLAIVGFSSDYPNKNLSLADTVNTIKITAGNIEEEKEEEEVTTEDTEVVEEDTNENDSDWNLVFMVFCVSALVIAIILMIVAILLMKKNKK